MTTQLTARYCFGLGAILTAIFTQKYSWILFLIILACAWLLAFGTKKKSEVEEIETGSIVDIQRHRLLDAPEGVVVDGNIYLTADGHAFVWPDSNEGGADKVWHSNGKWYGQLGSEKIRDSQITSWSSIRTAGGKPITLVQ
jgi:hypothetical protein